MSADVLFDADRLMQDAASRSGSDDFGPGDFREGLGVLIEAYQRAGLHEAGAKTTYKRLRDLLTNRVAIQRTLQARPEIRDRTLRSPVYLTGLPRTGTSALFSLLGSDPAARPLLFWETKFPTPFDGPLPDSGEDPRLTALREGIERARAHSPAFSQIHDLSADGPEEGVGLLAHTFQSVMMGIEPLLPPYDAYFQSCDQRPVYAYYIDLLRMIDAERPGDRWLLKSPCHLWALDVIVAELPDACIVQTHRNPLEAIPSYCSMMEAIMEIRESVDRAALGPTVLEYLARSLETGLAARDNLDPSRIFDVDYRRFVSDPEPVVRELYQHFGFELPPETVSTMGAYGKSHRKDRHGKHEYTLEMYGLTATMVRDRLAAYVERFGLPVE
jgi:hypothetical protein